MVTHPWVLPSLITGVLIALGLFARMLFVLLRGQRATHKGMAEIHFIVNSRNDRLEGELRDIRSQLQTALASAAATEAIRTTLALVTARHRAEQPEQPGS